MKGMIDRTELYLYPKSEIVVPVKQEHPHYLSYAETKMIMNTLKWIVENDPHPTNVKNQIKSDYDKIMTSWNPEYQSK